MCFDSSPPRRRTGGWQGGRWPAYENGPQGPRPFGGNDDLFNGGSPRGSRAAGSIGLPLGVSRHLSAAAGPHIPSRHGEGSRRSNGPGIGINGSPTYNPFNDSPGRYWTPERRARAAADAMEFARLTANAPRWDPYTLGQYSHRLAPRVHHDDEDPRFVYLDGFPTGRIPDYVLAERGVHVPGVTSGDLGSRSPSQGIPRGTGEGDAESMESKRRASRVPGSGSGHHFGHWSHRSGLR
ncbi:MAG: hypothetical protein M1827_002102 [Pycnora praestabilis]|nr:MAG: hypothetical protein M1827_002102 [Pycnora praestabilis]